MSISGVKYLEDCPKEPRIPVYLLVGGCFGMIKLLFTFWRNLQVRRHQDVDVILDDHDSDEAFASTTYKTMNVLLFLFLIGWQIAGSFWAAQIWVPHFEQLLHEPSNWCDRNVYMFTVYQIGASYGAMVVFILVLCSLTCWVRCRWDHVTFKHYGISESFHYFNQYKHYTAKYRLLFPLLPAILWLYFLSICHMLSRYIVCECILPLQ